MSIVRKHRPAADNYTIISNAWVRDENLSYQAIGLLTQLMSHREGWQVSIRSLAGKHKAGRDAIRTIVGELEAAGYLVRSQPRDTATQRFSEAMWETREPESDGVDEPCTDEPTTAGPTTKKNIKKEEQVKERKSTPTRIPEDFALTDEMRDWAKANAPEVDVDLQTANFIDYWQSKAKDNTKLDWLATWRAWMRNDQDRKARYKPKTVSRGYDREKENAERRARLLAEMEANEQV